MAILIKTISLWILYNLSNKQITYIGLDKMLNIRFDNLTFLNLSNILC